MIKNLLKVWIVVLFLPVILALIDSYTWFFTDMQVSNLEWDSRRFGLTIVSTTLAVWLVVLYDYLTKWYFDKTK